VKDISIAITRMPGNDDLPLPTCMTPGAAGMDVAAAVAEDTVIEPGKWVLVPAGFSLALPCGYEAQLRPRSGLALKHGITLLNSPGTIDSDYRGEVALILINLGREPFTVRRGERVAQMLVAPYCSVNWEEKGSLDLTTRGDGGFGHTR
jgi:dUTP pyrophosphatase